MIYVQHELLHRFMVDVFRKIDVPKEDARVCADVLIESDLRGIDSHGINRCKPIYYDRIKAGILNTKTQLEIVRETPTTAVIDGHNGMGHVIAKQSMQMAIDKAGRYGLSMITVRNSTHYGIAGYYALMAVNQGMIGVTGTNARPSVAPTHGVENMLGTNPLTFGMPTDEPFPFVLDCATSVTQRGKIEYYTRRNQSTPEGLVISQEGEGMTDSMEILKALQNGSAALLPVGGADEETGGHKGYGYATVVEILSSALQSGQFMKALTGIRNGKPAPIELGHFFMAIQVEAFCELDVFKKNTGDLLRALRQSKLRKGHDRIYTAGEKEYEIQQERLQKGIPIPESVQNDLNRMREECRLNTYRFPWD